MCISWTNKEITIVKVSFTDIAVKLEFLHLWSCSW